MAMKMLEAMGIKPEELLTREAQTYPHRSYASSVESNRHDLDILKYSLLLHSGSTRELNVTNTEGRHRYTVYEAMIVALIIVLSTVTLVSLFQIQSLQNQINGLRQIGLSVVSGKVTTSTDNLANVPYASTIMFDAGFNYKVNSTIILQNYTTYLIDGLGYGVIIEFSDKTLCYVGTFVPKGAFVVHSFYCQRPTVY